MIAGWIGRGDPNLFDRHPVDRSGRRRKDDRLAHHHNVEKEKCHD